MQSHEISTCRSMLLHFMLVIFTNAHKVATFR